MTIFQQEAPEFDKPHFVDMLLEHLIVVSGITNPSAFRRLNALEHVLAMAVRRWHGDRPIVPARDLRMASATVVAMFEWVDDQDAVAGGSGSV